jgi:hypothetical protein
VPFHSHVSLAYPPTSDQGRAGSLSLIVRDRDDARRRARVPGIVFRADEDRIVAAILASQPLTPENLR